MFVELISERLDFGDILRLGCKTLVERVPVLDVHVPLELFTDDPLELEEAPLETLRDGPLLLGDVGFVLV